MSEIGIFKAISAVMSEIGAVGKNQKNKEQNFMFRGIDDIMNAINPALTNNKVFIIPEVMEHKREERKTAKGNNLIYSICRVRYTFCTEDGSSVQAITVGEGMDSGDKSSNKAMAAAFKYACFQIFCIPTEEIKDPDEECHEVVDRVIDSKEKEMLEKAALRTGMNLSEALKKFKINKIEDLPVSVYTKWMIKLASQESLPPPMPEGMSQEIPEELPFI